MDNFIRKEVCISKKYFIISTITALLFLIVFALNYSTQLKISWTSKASEQQGLSTSDVKYESYSFEEKTKIHEATFDITTNQLQQIIYYSCSPNDQPKRYENKKIVCKYAESKEVMKDNKNIPLLNSSDNTVDSLSNTVTVSFWFRKNNLIPKKGDSADLIKNQLLFAYYFNNKIVPIQEAIEQCEGSHLLSSDYGYYQTNTGIYLCFPNLHYSLNYNSSLPTSEYDYIRKWQYFKLPTQMGIEVFSFNTCRNGKDATYLGRNENYYRCENNTGFHITQEMYKKFSMNQNLHQRKCFSDNDCEIESGWICNNKNMSNLRTKDKQSIWYCGKK